MRKHTLLQGGGVIGKRPVRAYPELGFIVSKDVAQ